MAGEHTAQAAALLAEAERRDGFTRMETPKEVAESLRQEALVHAVLAVAEEIASYHTTIAER